LTRRRTISVLVDTVDPSSPMNDRLIGVDFTRIRCGQCSPKVKVTAR